MRSEVKRAVFSSIERRLVDIGYKPCRFFAEKNSAGGVFVPLGGKLFRKKAAQDLFFFIYFVPDGKDDSMVAYIGWSKNGAIPYIENIADIYERADDEFLQDKFISKIFDVSCGETGVRLMNKLSSRSIWTLVPLREVEFGEAEERFHDLFHALAESDLKASSIDPESDECLRLCEQMANRVVDDIVAYALPYFEKKLHLYS